MSVNVENVAVLVEHFAHQFVNFWGGEFAYHVLFASISVSADKENPRWFIRFAFVSCNIKAILQQLLSQESRYSV